VADNTSTLKSTAKKAGIFSFVFVMFSYTTGGPFGLEEMVTTSGPGMTLLYQMPEDKWKLSSLARLPLADAGRRPRPLS